jgi:hypothetical protein
MVRDTMKAMIAVPGTDCRNAAELHIVNLNLHGHLPGGFFHEREIGNAEVITILRRGSPSLQ